VDQHDDSTAPPQGQDPTDLVVTRSEERLHVDVQRRPYQRVRVRKTVVTETVTVEVQVRREELHVEREPVTDPEGSVDLSGAGEGTPADGGVLEIVLHEERPVVDVQVVPVERVRVLTEVVSADQVLRGEVRSERIDLDGVSGVAPGAVGRERS
jgi:uncharacterized protein (TIGR02271 family)